jgi:hypothetical protein
LIEARRREPRDPQRQRLATERGVLERIEQLVLREVKLVDDDRERALPSSGSDRITHGAHDRPLRIRSDEIGERAMPRPSRARRWDRRRDHARTDLGEPRREGTREGSLADPVITDEHRETGTYPTERRGGLGDHIRDQRVATEQLFTRLGRIAERGEAGDVGGPGGHLDDRGQRAGHHHAGPRLGR